MTTRNKGLADQQTLVWNAENRLSEVQDNNGNLIESYWYDIGGARVKKTSGATTTYTFFGHYEEEVTNGVTTAISHYSFGSLRIAVKRGSALYHSTFWPERVPFTSWELANIPAEAKKLHGDHLGSTSLTTLSSTSVASRAYFAYGAERSATGDLQTDRTFGTFISPDSLVPNAGRVINYNRFLYARGNPLKYTDPSGYASAEAIGEWEAKNSWYNARGWAWGGSHWNMKMKQRVFQSKQAAVGVLGDVGITAEGSWDPGELQLLIEGIDKFAETIGGLYTDVNGQLLSGFNARDKGLARLKELTGGSVSWYRREKATFLCGGLDACTLGIHIEFYDSLFDSPTDKNVQGIAVHEMAHVIHNMSCATYMGMGQNCTISFGLLSGVAFGIEGRGTYTITPYGNDNQWEYWAEAVADWVYMDQYKNSAHLAGELYKTTPVQRDYIMRVFGGVP